MLKFPLELGVSLQVQWISGLTAYVGLSTTFTDLRFNCSFALFWITNLGGFEVCILFCYQFFKITFPHHHPLFLKQPQDPSCIDNSVARANPTTVSGVTMVQTRKQDQAH